MSEVVEVRGVASEACVGQWVYAAEGSPSENGERRYTIAREDSDGLAPVATVGRVLGVDLAELAAVDDAQRRAWRAKHRFHEGSTD